MEYDYNSDTKTLIAELGDAISKRWIEKYGVWSLTPYKLCSQGAEKPEYCSFMLNKGRSLGFIEIATGDVFKATSKVKPAKAKSCNIHEDRTAAIKLFAGAAVAGQFRVLSDVGVEEHRAAERLRPISIDPSIPLSEEVNAYLIDSLNREIKPLHLPVREIDAEEHIRAVFERSDFSVIYRGITTKLGVQRPGCTRGFRRAAIEFERNIGINGLMLNPDDSEEKVGRRKVRVTLLNPIKQTEDEVKAMFVWTEAE